MYTALIVLAASYVCTGLPQGSVRGSVSGPVHVTYSQDGQVHTQAYNFEDLGFGADGDLSFLPSNLPKLGAGSLSGGLSGGSVSVTSGNEQTRYSFDDFAFQVASRVAGSVDGSVSGPITISAQKDGQLTTSTYNFDKLTYKAQLK